MSRFIAVASALLLIPGTASLIFAGSYSAAALYPLPVPAGFSITYPRQVVSSGTIGNGTVAGSNPIVTHALLWSAPSGTAIDLTPTNLGEVTGSRVNAAYGNQQVGLFTGATTNGYSHAVIWNGSANSAIDLEPTNLSGVLGSQVYGTDGTHQVGRGWFGTSTNLVRHALLWTGTADSAIDLSPTKFGLTDSGVSGVGGGQEVGNYSSSTIPLHAILWNGTADSAIDLHPSDATFAYSSAIATDGTQQVGLARASGGNSQAFLWFGSADSAVNLTPTTLAGINASVAVATNGRQQVGYGYDGFSSGETDHALVWSGTAGSVVDLQPLLPSSGDWDYSDATSIDNAGDIFGYAHGTYGGVTGQFAVEWTPVPEPASLSLVCIAGIAAPLFKRCRRRIAAPSAMT